MKSVVFMDVDGVLHRGATKPVGRPLEHLPVVEAWLRARPHVHVVISSTWRFKHSLDQLQALFAEDLRSRVVDVTPSLRFDPDYSGVPPEYERQREIERWLSRAAQQPARWAALDDWTTNFEPGLAQLVLCDPAKGVTPAQLEQLDKLLGAD